MRVDLWRVAVGLEEIEAPFPHVPRHVFDPEWTRANREGTDRRTLRKTIIDLAIAPGENGVAIGEIRQVAAPFLIAPRIFAPIAAARRVFPFRLGRQSITPPLARAEPLAKLNRVAAAHVNDRVPLVRAGCALAGVARIKHFVLRI